MIFKMPYHNFVWLQKKIDREDEGGSCWTDNFMPGQGPKNWANFN